ncbi:hypothetical protein JMJ35_005266 [Cladonia borealis]|uniref:G domain-containing protein n=1 Tax=Cladonia borealis TaxID=184061 RepID=A0AA39R2H1_9LECA|nr:hypothetical protein JMJ35_005266 [Cladonia borealis]
MDPFTEVLTLPALGQDVQLGMLYDVRTAQFFGGLSLWNNNVVNAEQTLDEHAVQNADFTYSYSLDEARNHVTLDVESSLSLDLGLIKATGSARYLNNKKSSTFEARVDVSCTIVRRTRRIPQEILASMQHERNLENPHITHFVAEVVEGGSATLSFVQSCPSSEDVKKILGQLKAKIMKLPVRGKASVEFSEESESIFDNLKIFYSGAMAENVANIDDARRVAHEMPTKLRQQLNTLYYKLLPLTVLDSTVRRIIRKLDANLVNKTAAALKAGTMARFRLKDQTEQEVFQNSFPVIMRQILNIQTAFAATETEFTQAARRLLPELRDGTTNYSTKISELEMAGTLFEQRTRIVEQFVVKKKTEACVLRATIASLLADGFENYLGRLTPRSLTDTEVPRLLLSFGGALISRSQHPLQRNIESSKLDATSNNNSDGSDDDDSDNEWFENPQTVANVREACTALRRQRLLALATATFGVVGIDKAYRPGREKRTKTSVGDIVLDYKGKLLIVTGMLPKAPAAPTMTIKDQTFTVAWLQERGEDEELTILTTGFVVRFSPQSNSGKDGAFPRATGNEAFAEVRCEASETTVVIDKAANGALLSDDCDYEVELSVETIIGRSDWSRPVVGRTLKLPSVASRMIEFYLNNRTIIKRSEQGVKPWELYKSGGKETLFLGHTVQAQRLCTDSRFKGQLAMRIVDVAAEFEPQVVAAPTQDQDKAIVVVFAGCSGHGKSTQINAFISYLLGGEFDDFARIMVIDDRGANQAQWVTQHVTCYRIRPLSSLFEGKTLLIVDTPGYGDSRGIERDAFVTAAMAEFFKTIEHVNAIIFTCQANENRTTLLSPVSACVFSLFAKDVKSCLRTIYTFSDAGTPLARTALTELRWPVENGEVEVNNAAFTVEVDARNHDKVRDWWVMSVKGQFRVMQMLLHRPPILTAGSASVTQNRFELEQKCELVEMKSLRTANHAQILIADLGALAKAVGAGPSAKLLVEEDRAIEKTLPPGQKTILCLNCNFTCLEICAFSGDDCKAMCIAMSGDNCKICKGRCHWSHHKMVQHIIVIEKHSEWVVPEDLIKRWNTINNTLEGALLDAIDAYLKLQEELRNDILYLAKLNEELKKTALFHDPTALIQYIELLIKTARARGAPTEQIVQLTKVKKTLILVGKVKERGVNATLESQTMIQVLGTVKKEMSRRKRLHPRERAREEEKSCSLYNDLCEQLPPEILRNAPEPLRKWGRRFEYSENLQAIVNLVQVVLKDGGVVAAIAASN